MEDPTVEGMSAVKVEQDVDTIERVESESERVESESDKESYEEEEEEEFDLVSLFEQRDRDTKSCFV
jgi:hypothetical protein